MKRALALGMLLMAAPAGARSLTREDRVLQNVGFVQKLNAQVPLDLVFNDENGQPVKLSSYFGRKPVILSLVYYQCPMLCTEVLNGIVRTMRAMPLKLIKDYDVVTVSFDPRDTPKLAADKKRVYLDSYGHPENGAGWSFLTGSENSVKALADAVGFRYVYDPVLHQFAHASGIILLTPEGRVARYFFGVEYPVQDVRLSLVEASHDKIGTPVDQLLLYCYHYDPETGRYGVVITRVLRLGAVCTVIFLVVFVAILLRKEKHP